MGSKGTLSRNLMAFHSIHLVTRGCLLLNVERIPNLESVVKGGRSDDVFVDLDD